MSEKQTPLPIKISEVLTPSNGHELDGHLRYESLADDIAKYTRDHPERLLRFEQSAPGSHTELRTAQQLASFYLLKSAKKLNDEHLTPEARDEWARHFTKASIELCGEPNAETAKYLEKNPESLERFEKTAQIVHEYLEWKYSNVFAALDLENAPHEITPSDATRRFRAGLSVLRRDFDTDWRQWRVVAEDGSDKMSTSSQTETITIGLNRANITPSELKGLFAHETLVHGLSGLNGYKQSKRLGEGLPQYLNFQEGLGGFVEYAVTGKVPEKIIDRYVDTAYALGQLDGRQHTRTEVIVRGLARAERRQDSATVKMSKVDILKTVTAHANRIYRGTRGDEHIGVFTKDIAYYEGFVAVGEYLEQKLSEGYTIEAIFDYLMQGKFDPYIETHTATLRYALASRPEVY